MLLGSIQKKTMILLLSHLNYEQGTNSVIDYLESKKANYRKIHLEDFLENEFLIDVNEGNIQFGPSLDINLNEINVIWLRRWQKDLLEYNENWPYNQIRFEFNYELEKLSEFFFFLLKDKKWLTTPENAELDKLTQINIAKKLGIKTPKTKVLTDKKSLKTFLKNYKNLITKPIYYSYYYTYDEFTYVGNTTKITPKRLEQIPEYFPPSLFQEMIERDYEIRSFYLDGVFYSTAILTTGKKNADIKIDTHQGKNKWVSYKLPEKVTQKLKKLMSQLNLKTGSLDIIKNNDGYFFLEVNPVGQYTAPSNRCNYNVEEKIAEWLIKNDKK